MERWKSLVALTVVAALAAGPAWAQSTTTPSDKGTTSGSMQKDKASPGGTAGGGEMKAGKSGGAKSAGAGGNKDQVKAAQQALKDKGHDPGAIDGVMGPKTKQALKEFQKKEGLKESGQLDSETMAKLDMKTSSSGASGSTASSGQDTSASSPSASPSTAGQESSKSDAGSTGGQDATKKQ